MTGPGRYELVVPDGWWAVDLVPGRWQRQIAALVDHQWRGIDDAPHLKAEARAELERRARSAEEAGGLQLFLSVGALAGVPLSASLLISSVPLAAADELTELAHRAAESGRAVSHRELPAGPALRTRWREDAAPGQVGGSPADEAPLPATTCLDVHVPVPGAPRVLLLQFRTSLEPLADALVEVFDAISTTLRWRSSDTPSGGPEQDRADSIAAGDEGRLG